MYKRGKIVNNNNNIYYRVDYIEETQDRHQNRVITASVIEK